MLKSSQLVYIGLELVIAVLAVAGNVLVCLAVCLNSNLQSITNFFVVSLAVADIAVGLLAIPLAITISTGFCANFFGCLFIACFVLILTQSSIFSLLAIAVDRYIAIKNPLRYSSLVTSQRAKTIITLCWLLSGVIGLMPILGWNRGWNTTAHSSTNGCPAGLTECLFEGVVTMDYMIYFNFFGCVLLPLLVMLVIYIHIFMAARRQLRLMGLKVAQSPAPGQTAAPLRACRSTLQKEVHAAKSLAIIVGLFAVCWLPLHIINCFNYLCRDCGRSHIWVTNIAIILSHANSVVNPFIYAYRIREFRLTFRKILYRHIHRRKDGQVFGAAGAHGRGAGSTSNAWTSSCTSKEGSTCTTVANSYVLEPGPENTSPTATQEASGSWTSPSEAASNTVTPIRYQRSHWSPVTQQPCIMGFPVQEGVRSLTNLGEPMNVLEVQNSASSVTFVNVHTTSLKYLDCVHPRDLTQVS